MEYRDEEIALFKMLEELHQQLTKCIEFGDDSGPVEQSEMGVDKGTTLHHEGGEEAS